MRGSGVSILDLPQGRPLGRSGIQVASQYRGRLLLARVVVPSGMGGAGDCVFGVRRSEGMQMQIIAGIDLGGTAMAT